MDILLQIKQQRDLQLQRELASVARPSFHEALSQEGIRIIGEIKRASPSKGQIALENFDLLKQATHYVEHGVAAFSILTEEAYFKGDNTFIPQVVEAFPKVPILRKDFIYTPFQVAQAKFLGASAILLIVRMLSDEQLQALHALAYDLQMDVLVEVHDEAELQRALRIPQLKILGINNRNLNTLISEEQRTSLLVVSESGYLSKEDLHYAQTLGVDALLIGEALMKGLLF